MKRYFKGPLHSVRRGFALIEALIAVVVLATGMLALTALQGALIRSSADAKARSILAAHAQAVMDSVRVQGPGIVAPGDTQISAGVSLPLARVQAAMGASSLVEESTVTLLGTAPNTFKRIDLVFTWDDAAGSSRVFRMSSAISPLTLSRSPLNDLDPPNIGASRPIVRRPLAITEGMIPLALGNGEDTAATNPKPELVGSSTNTYAADTRFNVLTYSANSTEDSLLVNDVVRVQKRIETAFVGCKCQMGLGGFPTGGSSDEFNVVLRAKAFRPAFWNGNRYTDPEEAADVVRGPDPTATQSELCDVCCRDHRDPSGVAGPKFNPWIAPHDHYLTVGGSPVSEIGSASFLEACRVVRVNGLWRVTPDPRVDDLALLATNRDPSSEGSTTAPANNNRATQSLVSSGATTSYVDYIYDYLRQKFYSKSTVDQSALQRTSGLNAPDYVPIAITDTNGYNDVTGPNDIAGITDPDVRWLHSRGLLVDELEPDAKAKIDKAIAGCAGSSPEEQAQCVLPFLPVTTINLTELAVWAGKQTSETGIDVSALSAATVNFGQALINRFASAVARVGPIGPLDDDDPVRDEQTFALTDDVSRTGTWLKVASPSGSVFGNPLNPIRGFATVAGPVDFTVRLAGVPGTKDEALSIKPNIEVGTSGTNPCTPASANNSNPYACSSESSVGIALAIGQYNRSAIKTNSNTTECNVSTKQYVCPKYTFNNVTVDGGVVTSATYSVASDTNLPTEKGVLGLLTVKDAAELGYPSSIVVTFTEVSPATPATPVCNVGGSGIASWSCP